MKRILDYSSLTFDASAETIDFSKIPRFDPERVAAVIHGPTGAMIYCPAAGKLGTWAGRVLTVTTTDTTAMGDNDLLIPIYDDPMAEGNSPVTLHESFSSLDSSVWTLTKASGDVVQVEGNVGASSYLHMSLDPLTENTETTLYSVDLFDVPMRLSFALGTCLQHIGQEKTVMLRTVEEESDYTPVAISSYSQTTTNMVYTTSAPHGLLVGDRVSIYGITADSRANYSNVVVASVGSTTTFTVSAGAAGSIPSLTISGSGAGGNVYRRCTMDCAVEGVSKIYESGSVATASFHAKNGSAREWHSGTFAGMHVITVDTSAFVTANSSEPGVQSTIPNSVDELLLTPECYEWMGKAADSSAAGYTVRYRREVNGPSAKKRYKIGFTIRNAPGLTRPVAKITSSAKAGSNTSTIVHDGGFTFTTGMWIQLYGRRDTTNFANVTTPVQISSIINATSFTVVDGGVSTTSTTYGGSVHLVNGSQNQQGIVNQNIQNAVRGGDGRLVLTGSVSWTSVAIGEFVNVYGVRDNTTGADVGVDGIYRVYNTSGSTLTLESIAGTGSGVVSTIACGGSVVRRDGLRICSVRLGEYSRSLVESVGGMNRLDVASSAPVAVQNSVTIGTLPSIPTGSNVIGALTANQSVNLAQLVGTAITSYAANGSTSRVLTVGIAGPTANTDYSAQAWAAASGNGAVIAEANGLGAAATFDVNLTAWTAGASTGLDIYLQESPDNGTTYYDIWQCEALTAVGRCRIPAIPINGRRRMRWVNRGGAATTATVTVTAMEQSDGHTKLFQFFDRTASVGSGTAAAGTNSATYHIDMPDRLTVAVQTGTATAPASWKVQMSMDGTNWYDASAAISCPASSMTLLPITAGVTGRLMRVQCTVTGTSALVSAIHIGGGE